MLDIVYFKSFDLKSPRQSIILALGRLIKATETTASMVLTPNILYYASLLQIAGVAFANMPASQALVGNMYKSKH
jgi:hypothetical protein